MDTLEKKTKINDFIKSILYDLVDNEQETLELGSYTRIYPDTLRSKDGIFCLKIEEYGYYNLDVDIDEPTYGDWITTKLTFEIFGKESYESEAVLFFKHDLFTACLDFYHSFKTIEALEEWLSEYFFTNNILSKEDLYQFVLLKSGIPNEKSKLEQFQTLKSLDLLSDNQKFEEF